MSSPLALASHRLDSGKYPSPTDSTEPLEQNWRFRGMEELRGTLLSVAEWAGASTAAVNRFRRCGEHASVFRSESTGRLRVIADHCRNRWCPRCRVYVQVRTRRRIEKWLASADRHKLKFVTLTLQSSSQPLQEQIARLLKSFRSLRSSPVWRAASARGLAVVETTWNPTTARWHPHLHLLAEMSYLLKQRLSDAWRAASKGSFIVDIKKVRSDSDIGKLGGYLASYLAKEPPGVEPGQPDLVRQWVEALTATHWVVAFGKRQPPLEQEQSQPEADPGPWTFVAPLKTLILAARGGHEIAVALLRELDHAKESAAVFGDRHADSS